MKRRVTFLVATILFVAVGFLVAFGMRALHVAEQIPSVNNKQEQVLPPASAAEASHYTSRPMTLSWNRYEEITSDPDVWHLRASYWLYDQDDNQIGYQSLVSRLRPGVDEPGSGTIVVDDVAPTWPGLESGITYTVKISACWSSAYHDNVAIVFTDQEPDANGRYVHDRFQIYEWYDDCPVDPPTLTPRPTLTPEPTPTCNPTAIPYPTQPPLPTATQYPGQPP